MRKLFSQSKTEQNHKKQHLKRYHEQCNSQDEKALNAYLAWLVVVKHELKIIYHQLQSMASKPSVRKSAAKSAGFIGARTGVATGITIGATALGSVVGSAIPIPVVGTLVGGAIGLAAGTAISMAVDSAIVKIQTNLLHLYGPYVKTGHARTAIKHADSNFVMREIYHQLETRSGAPLGGVKAGIVVLELALKAAGKSLPHGVSTVLGSTSELAKLAHSSYKAHQGMTEKKSAKIHSLITYVKEKITEHRDIKDLLEKALIRTAPEDLVSTLTVRNEVEREYIEHINTPNRRYYHLFQITCQKITMRINQVNLLCDSIVSLVDDIAARQSAAAQDDPPG